MKMLRNLKSYVIFQVGPQKVKSKVIKSSLNPVWNEKLQLCINGFSDILKVTMMDEDFSNADDFMGECDVELSLLQNLKEGEEVEVNIPLKKVKKGTIHFKLSYAAITH